MADWIFDGTVIKVVDGDTVDILLKKQVDVGFNRSVTIEAVERLRLARINSPEMKTGAAGQQAKDYVTACLLNQPIMVETKKLDKYGRYVAEITVKGVNFSDEMVRLGYAVPYMV